MTNVLVINGSARTEKGNTAFVVTPFIEGMKKAGATVELLYSKEQKIRPCTGCFKCWNETIGDCFIKDDMKEIYEKLKKADILVLATPVYIPFPGIFQNFINRLVPLIEPMLQYREGRTRAKFHDDVRISKIIGVITGGWWEIGNLEVVKKIFEEIALNTSTEFFETILRPHAYSLRQETEKNLAILSKIESVGETLISDGRMDREDLAFISQPLVDKDDYLTMSNQNYLNWKEKQISDN